MTIWQQREQETRETELYEQIGRLKMELGWLKKKEWDAHRDAQRAMIEPTHPDLSIRRQCELIGLNRLGGKGAGDADPPSTTRGQIVQPNKIILGKYPGLCYHASRIAHLNQWTSLPGSV